MGGVLAATMNIIKSTMVFEPLASVITNAPCHNCPATLPTVLNVALPVALIAKPAGFVAEVCAEVAKA